jgi:hypothetical protein
MPSAVDHLPEAVRLSRRRLIPVLLPMYILAFLDGANIGFAKEAFQTSTGGVVLFGLRAVRNSKQSDHASDRSPDLDWAHHDHVGIGLRRSDVRHWPIFLLPIKDLAGRRRQVSFRE